MTSSVRKVRKRIADAVVMQVPAKLRGWRRREAKKSFTSVGSGGGGSGMDVVA